MSSRTKSRKRAVDALFAADVREVAASQMLDDAKIQNADRQNQDQIFEYAKSIVDGVTEHLADIDTYLEAYSQGWTLERMPALDRTIMRVAVWEILYNDDIPDGVAIDEAVELAKEYSTDDSPSFVNGLLHKVSSTKRAL
ncbi:MAG: transcription antitermination factor NusB [Microbacteriaceae bacterium]